MTPNLSGAVNDLLRREPAKLVAATGIFFGALAQMYPRQCVNEILESYRNGVWGEEAAEGVGFPVLRSTNMRGSRADVSGAAWRQISKKQASACALQTGDILVTKSSGSIDLVGKAVLFIHPNDGRTYLFSNFTQRLRPNAQFVEPGFLGWFLRSPQALGWRYESQQNAVGLRNLQTKEFLSQLIPVPPLAAQRAVVSYLDGLESGEDRGTELPSELGEQRRIVARIEELAAQIHEARALRQKAADEARALFRVSLRVAIGGSKSPLVELHHVCSAIIDNLHSNPRYSESGAPCVRSPDIAYGTLNLDAALRTDEEEYRRRTVRGEPRPDDVVLVREGGGTGKCALVLPNHRFSLGQRVMMLRPNQEKVIPRFFLYQLLSPLVQEEQILPLCKGSASPHLNIGALKRFRVRLPPLREQRHIVAKLDALQAEVDTLKRLQAETAAELDALLPSILDKAFKGEL